MDASVRDTWRLIRPHLTPRLPALLGVVLLGALTAIGPTTILLLVQPLWTLVLFPGTEGPETGAKAPRFVEESFAALRDAALDGPAQVDGVLTDEARRTALFVIVAAAFGLAVFAAVTQYAFTWLARWLSFRMVVELRVRLARHLMGLSVRYHHQRQFGDLLSRISADVQKTLATVQTSLKDFVQQPAYVLASLTVAAVAAPQMTVGLLILLPLLAIPISVLARRIRKGSTRSLTTLGASVQVLTQMFQGIRTVKAYRAEERELESYRGVNERYLRHSMQMVRAIALTQGWALMFSHGGLALLLIPIGLLSIRGQLFAGPENMMVFFMAMAQVQSHVKRLTKAVTALQESAGASARLNELLAERVDLVETAEPKPVGGIGRGLAFEGVGYRYRDEEGWALRNVTLEVASGETLAVVGPSGAGKSTLADLVCRFIDPTEGRVRVDGVDLRDVALDDWIALFAHVDQVPFLFHASIEENIRYGRPDATDEEVRDAARAASIHDFVEGLPAGYATDVAEAGARLSGGQRQRIVIARAILKNAPLLILDEATSALDSESEAAVQAALDRLMRDRTVIVIAHRLSTIRGADRIAVLEAGELVEVGPHEELLASGGTYARLYALQHRGAV